MTEEHIKQTSKITEFARNMVKQSNYPKDLQDHIIATCMVVVIEATQELEKELEQVEKDLADYQFNYPTIKELQKENAELKEKYDTCLRENTGLKIHSAYVEKKLTKAKKLLKKVVTDFHNMDCVSVHIDKTIAEAEQFISEVEK